MRPTVLFIILLAQYWSDPGDHAWPVSGRFVSHIGPVHHPIKLPSPEESGPPMQGMPLISKTANPLTAVRCDAGVDGGRSSHAAATPLLSVSKPSWIVTAQSNVRIEKGKIPDSPCVVCRGSGRVDCHECHGRGRTNHVQSTVLPKGEWPKWCRSCGGSGLGYCDRCLGTGEYRYIMGFQFMKRDTNHIQENRAYQTSNRRGSHSFTDQLLNEVQLDSSA